MVRGILTPMSHLGPESAYEELVRRELLRARYHDLLDSWDRVVDMQREWADVAANWVRNLIVSNRWIPGVEWTGTDPIPSPGPNPPSGDPRNTPIFHHPADAPQRLLWLRERKEELAAEMRALHRALFTNLGNAWERHMITRFAGELMAAREEARARGDER